MELKTPLAPCLAPGHRYLPVGTRLSPLDQGGNAQEPPTTVLSVQARRDLFSVLSSPRCQLRSLQWLPVTYRLPSLGQSSSSSAFWEFSAFPQAPSSMQYGLAPGSFLTSMSQHVRSS